MIRTELPKETRMHNICLNKQVFGESRALRRSGR
jgi:hypothetical protein